MSDPISNPEEFPSTPAFRALVRFGIIPIIFVFYLTAVLHFDFTPDGTYVYLQYASHLANGQGFTFNDGTPSYGVSGPLWVAMIAGGAIGGLDPYVVAKTLDLVFASLSVMILYFVAFAILRSKVYALAACCMVSFDSWLLQWAGSGMETSLGILLSLLAIWYVYRNDYILASLACAVFTLVRPEGIILFLLIQVDNIINSHEWAPARRALIRSVMLYGMIVLPWLVIAWAMFGTVLPGPWGAALSGSYWSDAVTIAGSEVRVFGMTQTFPICFLIVGTVIAVHRLPWNNVRLELFPLFWVLALFFFYPLFNIPVGSRSLLLFLPELVVFGLWGMKKMQEFWKLEWRVAGLALFLLVLSSIGQNQFVFQSIVLPQVSGVVEGTDNCLKPIAYWLRENGGPGTTVVSPDAGLVGYISQVRVFDTGGLVNPEMRGVFRQSGYDDGMTNMVYETIVHPNFVLDRSRIAERLASPKLVPVMTREFPGIGMLSPAPIYYTLYRGVP